MRANNSFKISSHSAIFLREGFDFFKRRIQILLTFSHLLTFSEKVFSLIIRARTVGATEKYLYKVLNYEDASKEY
jgi:hypothetical protein